jgi:hypothetical protein
MPSADTTGCLLQFFVQEVVPDMFTTIIAGLLENGAAYTAYKIKAITVGYNSLINSASLHQA